MAILAPNKMSFIQNIFKIYQSFYIAIYQKYKYILFKIHSKTITRDKEGQSIIIQESYVDVRIGP